MLELIKAVFLSDYVRGGLSSVSSVFRTVLFAVGRTVVAGYGRCLLVVALGPLTANAAESDMVSLPAHGHLGMIVTIVFLVLLMTILVWLGIRHNKAIEHANAQLERRVAERTAALSDANAALNHEIAERKQAEEKLRQIHKMEAVGTMAGGVAHDFNNILAAIIPYTHLAMEESQDRPEVQENLKQVLVAAERARNLVEQMLTFSGQKRRERCVLDLKSVANEALHLLRSTLPPSVKLVCKNDPDLPSIVADPTQMHQIFINLSTNAAEAMRNRQGVLEVTLNAVEVDADFARHSPDLHPGAYVRIAVRDNGLGMTADVQKRIFEPFFTTKKQGQGNGMGLAVVHGIVADHGGAILVQSQLDVGSCFEIFIPAHYEVAALPAEAVAAGDGEHILFVDDETALCAVFSHILTHLGYRVTPHSNPMAALEAFRAKPDLFDLVITDLSMPEMTGINLAKSLLEVRPDLPIILATGFGATSAMDAARGVGIRKVISKPIDPRSLPRILNEVLSGVSQGEI